VEAVVQLYCNPMPTIRLRYDELHAALRQALARAGMEPDRAERCARMFADATLDGVATHGINRFPRFMAMVESGLVDVNARPRRVGSHGAIERWDGNGGPGNLNAAESMAAAIDLSRRHGIGCVALANTNHWMRGGAYGWQAAEAGAIAICWTNTLPNMPPWGSALPRVGNNPLVVAVPRPPAHVVLDMAMSQFSVGALGAYRARGEALPVSGGFDERGELTRDAAAIEATKRLLPIGCWKGSGLALMLDLVAAMLSRGRATHEVAPNPEAETALSQVFLAFSPEVAGGSVAIAALAEDVLQHFAGRDVDSAAVAVRYPGERAFETRQRNLREGIPVDAEVWERILSERGRD
jgi:3-dehydro-L-gulonate 2-dehydrogenase